MTKSVTPSRGVEHQFAVLASGSRGNSTLVRGAGPGLLIDAGIGPRALGDRLESVGTSWSDVAAVVLTHTHGDHIDSGTFVASWPGAAIAFHCHEGHRAGLAADPGLPADGGGRPGLLLRRSSFLTSTGFRLEPITLQHDGGPTFGFRIEASAGRRGRPVSIGYLADTGSWSERMADVLADVDVLGVEFNHDVAMQKTSGRPWILIRRNLGDRGHLSNQQGAELVEAMLKRSRRGAMKHLVLLHLSQQCNQPGLAIEAARSAVRAAGRRVRARRAAGARPIPTSGSARDAARAGPPSLAAGGPGSRGGGRRNVRRPRSSPGSVRRLRSGR